MTHKTSRLTTRNFFARDGQLSRWHSQYEFRPGQLEMAKAVEAALNEKRHLIVEAGTGTGKTLAYLVPAILSGRRVVVSTGTKALQEQLFFKDIPFLQKHLERRLSVCYMKGRANYACRQKIYDAGKEPVLAGLEEVADFEIIRDWENKTETGDRAEITTLPARSTAWAKLDARREQCTGQKCTQFERCFITKMLQRARESDIIIVNHHLFFADLALRGGKSEGIIPDYNAVIFDEAHEIEAVAGEYFGASLSNYQVDELRRDILALARRKNFGSPELDRILALLEAASGRFFGTLPEREGRTAFQDPAAFLDRNQREVKDLEGSLELVGAHLELVQGAPEEAVPLRNRAAALLNTLMFWVTAGDQKYVYFSERRGRGSFLEATPIDVAAILEDHLFEPVDTVILTSATLAVGGTFDFVRGRLGIRHTKSLIVPGHFDYPSQAILYVPQHLPDPRSPEFTQQACEEVARLLDYTQGRAFLLFTSYQQMQLFHDRLSLEIDYPALVQGTGPNNALIEEFRRTPNCVLFATASFWQGVDVPGEQLSAVIIDKLPFAVPSDPVVEARARAIREAGGNPFYDYHVPDAAISLKQGFGRLIRSRSDRGLLAILDSRIVRQRYGQVFFDSLPDYTFTLEHAKIPEFLGRKERKRGGHLRA